MKHRHHRPPTTLWPLLALLGFIPVAGAQTAVDDEPPSAALLEFLGELDPVDDETWALIEQHALRDLANEDEVQDE